MTTYAPVPAFAHRRRNPRALAVILAGHAALIAAVMTAKMDLPQRLIPTITTVQLIDSPKQPPENPPPPPPPPNAGPRAAIDQPTVILPVPQPDQPRVDPVPSPMPFPDPGPLVGPGSYRPPAPSARPVVVEPRFVTPASDVKPPYPQSKLRAEEEAVLRLKLVIDPRGRVTSVEPVGSADPVFLAAARRHVIARWRYAPATQDGRAVASTTVVTLRFQLD
jgi:protein TonB